MEVCDVKPIIVTESDGNNSVNNNLHNDSDVYRTSDDTIISHENNCDIKPIEDTNQQVANININIYRYKFTDDFTSELFKFSKVHQYDDRKTFKEAWNVWMENNEEIVNLEYRRLKTHGYIGDIYDKMFKSARYYFRKKSTEKKEPVKRRIYVSSQKDLIDSMDEHINCNIESGDFKPSVGFDDFCKQNVDLLKEEIIILQRAGLTDANEIKAKIKKTYKNRYFLAISK